MSFEDDDDVEMGWCEAGDHSGEEGEEMHGWLMLHDPHTTWAFCEQHRREALQHVAEMAGEYGMSFEAAMKSIAVLYSDTAGDPEEVPASLAAAVADLPRDNSVDLASWQQAGFTDLAAFQWLLAGVCDPAVASAAQEQLSAEQAAAWMNDGVPSPEASAWRKLGITNPRDARAFRRRGVSPTEAEPALAAANGDPSRALGQFDDRS
jgi:hypothetical protein